MQKCRKRAIYAGTAFGFSNFILFAMYAAEFYFGGLFHKHYSLSFFYSLKINLF